MTNLENQFIQKINEYVRANGAAYFIMQEERAMFAENKRGRWSSADDWHVDHYPVLVPVAYSDPPVIEYIDVNSADSVLNGITKEIKNGVRYFIDRKDVYSIDVEVENVDALIEFCEFAEDSNMCGLKEAKMYEKFEYEKRWEGAEDDC